MFNQVPSRPKMARCSSDTKNGPITFRKPSGNLPGNLAGLFNFPGLPSPRQRRLVWSLFVKRNVFCARTPATADQRPTQGAKGPGTKWPRASPAARLPPRHGPRAHSFRRMTKLFDKAVLLHKATLAPQAYATPRGHATRQGWTILVGC